MPGFTDEMSQLACEKPSSGCVCSLQCLNQVGHDYPGAHLRVSSEEDGSFSVVQLMHSVAEQSAFTDDLAIL